MVNSNKKQIESNKSEMTEKPLENASDRLKSDDAEDRGQSSQPESGGFENSKDPTRYGDWEIAGRCIDF